MQRQPNPAARPLHGYQALGARLPKSVQPCRRHAALSLGAVVPAASPRRTRATLGHHVARCLRAHGYCDRTRGIEPRRDGRRRIFGTACIGSGRSICRHRSRSSNIGGGGARSDTWCQIRADALGKKLRRVEVLDAGTLGAAIIAGVGSKPLRRSRPQSTGSSPSNGHLSRTITPATITTQNLANIGSSTPT